MGIKLSSGPFGRHVSREILAVQELNTWDAWRAAIAELVATCIFVFTVAGVAVSLGIFVGAGATLTGGNLVAIALANGMTIAMLVASTARISGAHFNPAVTFSMVLTRKIGVTRGGMYVVAQLFGAILGAFLLKAVIPDAQEGNLAAHALGADIGVGAGMAVEAILTFVLVFVIFATAVDPRGPAHLAPLAIGMAVAVDLFIGVPLTGGSMNPARTVGTAWAAGQWAHHWVYWVGPMGGGAVAALLFEHVFLRDSGRPQETQ